MATMVRSLNTLDRNSSNTTETVEMQLAGCVLVTVVAELQWLDYEGRTENLNIEILIELINVLKLPNTNPEFVQQWRADFRRHIARNRYAVLYGHLVFAIIPGTCS